MPGATSLNVWLTQFVDAKSRTVPRTSKKFPRTGSELVRVPVHVLLRGLEHGGAHGRAQVHDHVHRRGRGDAEARVEGIEAASAADLLRHFVRDSGWGRRRERSTCVVVFIELGMPEPIYSFMNTGCWPCLWLL